MIAQVPAASRAEFILHTISTRSRSIRDRGQEGKGGILWNIEEGKRTDGGLTYP